MSNVSVAIPYVLMLLALIGLYRVMVRPYLLRRCQSPAVRRCQRFLNKLYRYNCGHAVAYHEKQRIKHPDPALTYGEIQFASFVWILDQVQPQSGECFYDLGSGSGIAVFIAALLYDFSQCCGVEILPGLFQLSQQLHERLIRLQPRNLPIKFLCDDLLKTDLSDAGVVFIHATGFFGDLWEAIVKRLNQCKAGTRIILVSKKLPKSHYHLISDSRQLMSWGYASVRIYEKTGFSM